jgi:signal transduction histidine kinase/ligand-binding sensor domain-containing protein/DNA-binding response OmpR family regulator
MAQSDAPIQFRSITIEDGLSQSTINDIVQDDLGFIWIGTQDGLNRYDGYTFHQFKNENSSPRGIPHDWIKALETDAYGHLWIGTRGGGLAFMELATERVFRFPYTTDDDLAAQTVNDILIDQEHERIWLATDKGIRLLHYPARFKHEQLSQEEHRLNSTDSTSTHLLAGQRITKLIHHNGTLWAGSMQHGLHNIDSTGNIIRTYLPPQTQASYSVKTLLFDSQDFLWVGTDNHGIYLFDQDRRQIAHYQDNETSDGSTINNSTVESLMEDRQGIIWIGTQGGGLNRFDPETQRFQYFEHQKNESGSLAHNTVYSLYQDRHRNLWVGTYLGGISIYNQAQKPFRNLRQQFGNHSGLTNNIVRALYLRGDHDLWIGTRGGGLNRYDLNEHAFIPTVDQTDSPRGLPDPKVNVIIDAPDNQLWIGTWGGGLHRYQPNVGVLSSYTEDSPPGQSVYDDRIRALYRDQRNRLWISSGELENGMLQLLDPVGNTIQKTPLRDEQGNPLDNQTVNEFWFASDQTLWIGTYNGLVRLMNPLAEPEEFRFHYYSAEDTTGTAIAGNLISSIYEDQQQRIWLSCYGEGLTRITPQKSSDTIRIHNFTNEDGLPDSGLFGILGDHLGNLWLSSNHGLIRFTPKTERFSHFLPSDGLQGMQFNQGAYYESSDAEWLFFGGTHGVTYFRPEEIHLSTRVPPVVLTEFKIFDQQVDMDTTIAYSHGINLEYDQNFFSFQFAALGYSNPGNSEYAYQLEGFDKEWIYSGTRRYASYTNLDPGSYRFKVKASNSDGIWSDAHTVLTVRVVPPFWMTNWFKAALLLVALLLGFWMIRYREQTLRISNARLERKVRSRTQELETTAKQLRRKSKEAQRANLAKSQFLAGISHELRTPLNAILGFGQLLKRAKNLTPQQTEYINTMHRSGEHLLSMINDVLDISKIEAGRMEVKPESIDLPQLIQDISDMFRLQCQEKQLNFGVQIDPEVPDYVYSDPGKIRQILVNLIGNAVKYTKQGTVTLRVHSQSLKHPESDNQVTDPSAAPSEKFEQQVQFEVEDTGPGIADDQLETIFEPFRQVSDNFSDGTGLGLAITYRLITLLDGSIDVHSQIDQGTTFRVNLPLLVLGFAERQTAEPMQVVGIKGDPHFDVLIVDDIDYNWAFLSALLSKVGMNCIEARNGKEALEEYKRYQPDLILMDLRMPVMSGQEAMQEIRKLERDRKKSEQTPILAVTASVFKESRSDLIKLGFDEFISKPFSEEELFNLIEKTTHIEFRRASATQQQAGSPTTSQGNHIQKITQAIQRLPKDERAKMIEAIELMDWNSLREIQDRLDSKSELHTYFASIIEEEDYSKLLSLNEWLNPN